jgi:hypothetical protein
MSVMRDIMDRERAHKYEAIDRMANVYGLTRIRQEFEPADCSIPCESISGCGHPKEQHLLNGACTEDGCKCGRYHVGPAT